MQRRARSVSRKWLRWLPGLVLLVCLGCGGVTTNAPSEGEQRIQQVAMMFVRFGSGPKPQGKAPPKEDSKSPPNEKAFKEFIKQLNPKELEALKITSVDEFLRSPRDN